MTFLRELEKCLVFIETKPKSIKPYEELYAFLTDSLKNDTYQSNVGNYILEKEKSEQEYSFTITTKQFSKNIPGMKLEYKVDFINLFGEYSKINRESKLTEFDFMKRFY